MVCFVSRFILFPFVHDTLHLYVRFENGGLKFGFIGASCDGTFGKVHVHVRPLCKKIKIKNNNLGLHVLDVTYEQCWVVCVCCRGACVVEGVEVVAWRLAFQPSHEWFEENYEDVQVKGVPLYGPSTNFYWGGGLIMTSLL